MKRKILGLPASGPHRLHSIRDTVKRNTPHAQASVHSSLDVQSRDFMKDLRKQRQALCSPLIVASLFLAAD